MQHGAWGWYQGDITAAVHFTWARPRAGGAIDPAPVSAQEWLAKAHGPQPSTQGAPSAYRDPMGGFEENYRLGMWQAVLFPHANMPHLVREAEMKALQGMPPKNYQEYVSPEQVKAFRVATPAVTSPMWWR